jgi:hypothetical protein
MSEVVLLLPNTDPFNKLKIMSEVVLLLPNTDPFNKGNNKITELRTIL